MNTPLPSNIPEHLKHAQQWVDGMRFDSQGNPLPASFPDGSMRRANRRTIVDLLGVVQRHGNNDEATMEIYADLWIRECEAHKWPMPSPRPLLGSIQVAIYNLRSYALHTHTVAISTCPVEGPEYVEPFVYEIF